MSEFTRFRAGPFHSVKARQGNRFVIPLPRGESVLAAGPRLIEDAAFLLLDQLRAFRTLAEHEELIMGRLGDTATPGIHAALEGLRAQGLLISEAEFLEAAAPKTRSAPAAISTVAIPTRGRSTMLDRCIESYRTHARQFGHKVRFVVATGKPESAPDDGRLNDKDESIAFLDVHHQEATVEALGRVGIDPAVARFALLGKTPDLPPGIGSAIGANRNSLLLACSGEAFLSVDDDTVCSLFASPSYTDALAFHSRGSALEMWFGPDLPVLQSAGELDLLAEAGRALGPAIHRAAALAPAEFEHRTLEKILHGSARTRAAQVGLAGDAATESPMGWLTSIGATRERLVESEDSYRNALGSRRLCAAVACETISESSHLMGYCVALDHRAELPPFPPLGRDEDGIFGIWMRAMEPESFTAHLPFAVLHEPAEARVFRPDALLARRGIGLNAVIRLTFEGLETGAPSGPAARLRWIGAQLGEVANLPLADFEALLVEQRLKSLSRAIGYFENALASFGSQPVWWATDMRRLIRRCEEIMVDRESLRFAEQGGALPAATREDTLSVYRTYARWCGALLREWTGMREASLQWRKSG